MSKKSPEPSALDDMFERPMGLNGSLDNIPLIAQKGHARRVELLERLEIGDVTKMTVVDFGMGAWGFSDIYRKLHSCYHAIGMDISQSALNFSIDIVRKTSPPYAQRFETYQSDGMDLPLPDNSVDLFFSGESIEHVKFPPRFLSEIHRVLKDDGQLIITTPNRDAELYKNIGEEYCTSPEHFWLFNYDELLRTVCEFFEVKVAYGFNGSFSSIEEDHIEKDDSRAEQWSREFENEPGRATGIILHLIKKQNIPYRYEISDLPAENVSITNAETYLPLEFGLKGLLLDSANCQVTVKRPASDGIVCRFWCHRWSGKALVASGISYNIVDLYSYHPGWKNWLSGAATEKVSDIIITPTMEKNPKAEASQVIYFETFTWKMIPTSRTGVKNSRPQGSSLFSRNEIDKAKLETCFLPGYGFKCQQPFVGTTVFHWFTSTQGNVMGPWKPLGGRASWTGKADFWKRQIREMMMANVDAIYLHCINAYEVQRVEFFKAYAQLRAEGWDVPKIAPFLDPFYLWRHEPIDVATENGQKEFVSHYIRFFQQYFAQNHDEQASSYLLTIDGKLVLSTWWVANLLENVNCLERQHVLQLLKKELSDEIPQLHYGIYMMSTALIDPDLKFSDERMVMFSGYAYGIHSVYNSIDVWHVQPGYWDQNIRKPGYLLPRDGGKPYLRAWDAIVANMPHVNRVYVESWNEYDEGSGIYAADLSEIVVNEGMHSNTDIFSDKGDPYEYILTTAEGAAKINGRPAYDAAIIRHTIPDDCIQGENISFSVTVRNEGNTRWSWNDDIELVVLLEQLTLAKVKINRDIDAGFLDDIGIVRGQVYTLAGVFAMPMVKGQNLIQLAMLKKGKVFSQKFDFVTHVSPETG